MAAVVARRVAPEVKRFIAQVDRSSTAQIIDLERRGVQATVLKQMGERLGLTSTRVFAMVGVPKATAEKKAAAGEWIDGGAGFAAIGLARLINLAEAIVANSTAPEAVGFDAGRWLGEWLETPQPALAGAKPGDLIGTPTGLAVVKRVLGAVESGSYQ